MWVLPLPLLLSLFLGLVILIALGWSLYVFYRIARKWRIRERISEPFLSRGERRLMIPAVLILLLCLFGKPLVMLFLPSGGDPPQEQSATPGTYISRPDGTRLYVESVGPAGAPTIVLTHGWGADHQMWFYAKRDLASQYRVVTWDLPGLGHSGQPRNRDYSIEKMSDDLRAVLATTQGPVVLVGHSIGGMINLTLCRRYPESLGSKVVGIVEMNSTYTNPVHTTKNSGMSEALQKPVGEPLLYATIALSPVVRVLNALRYYSGVSHIQNAIQTFAGTETLDQVDFVSRYEMTSTPSVIARGGLAMFHWDATDVLKRIPVPVLLIAGDRDTTTLPDASMHMQRTIRQAHLVMPSPAKHMGPLERHSEYNEAVASFAKQCFESVALKDGLQGRTVAPLATSVIR